MRFFAEEFLHDLDDFRHAGHAADEHDFLDVFRAHTGIRQSLPAGLDGPLDEVADELFQLCAGQLRDHVLRAAGVRRNERQVDLAFLRRGEFDLGPLRRFLEALQRHPVFAQVDTLIFLKLLDEPVHHTLVEVVATEIGVAVRGLDLEHAVADFQDGHVERPAAEIVDGNALVFFLSRP